MPIKAAQTVEIPEVSLPSYVFGSPTAILPDDPILLDPEQPHERFLTLSTYRKWSQSFANGLRREGLQTGERVLFIAGNSIAWPIPFMGTIMAGGVLTGASTTLPFEALSRLGKDLEPSVLLADEKGLDKAVALAPLVGVPQSRVFLIDKENLFLDQNGLLGPAAPFDWTPFTSPDQLAAINYTSGSTGFSKGVMVSHRNIVANAVQYIEQQKLFPFGPEQGPSMNVVMWAPLYHVIGQNQSCVICPKLRIHNYLMDGPFELESLLRYTQKYRPPVMFLVPPLVHALLSHPARTTYDLSSVVDVLVGGAPLRQALVERLQTFMPNPDCRVIQAWGMTEVTLSVTSRNPLDRTTSESVGKLLPGVEAKIMRLRGATNTEVAAAHEPGELWIRSPSVAQGYWRNADQTAATFLPDGWLRTGDFAHYDEQHRLYVSERVQDVIFSLSAPGAYVLPTDLETVLLGIPGVVDAGVTAVDFYDTVRGLETRAPRGFIVVDDSSGLTVDHALDEFNVKVRSYERLMGGLYIVQQIPRLGSVKVDRVALSAIQVE